MAMYGTLSGEGPADPIIGRAGQQDSGSGSGHHAMNPDQFKGLTGGGGEGAGAAEGAAAGGAEAGGLAELAPLLLAA